MLWAVLRFRQVLQMAPNLVKASCPRKCLYKRKFADFRFGSPQAPDIGDSVDPLALFTARHGMIDVGGIRRVSADECQIALLRQSAAQSVLVSGRSLRRQGKDESAAGSAIQPVDWINMAAAQLIAQHRHDHHAVGSETAVDDETAGFVYDGDLAVQIENLKRRVNHGWRRIPVPVPRLPLSDGREF